MIVPNRHVFSIEQLADRWGVDAEYVQQLIFTRQIPQAFVVSGPAKILTRDESGVIKVHPDTAIAPIRTRLLVSTLYTMPDERVWPLSFVRRVYEYVDPHHPGKLSLEHYCEYNRSKHLDWKIEFQEPGTVISGRDRHLIAVQDIVDFEIAHDVEPAPPQEDSRKLRDSRKQRCRVVATILWRRDPTATLRDIFAHEWIKDIACEGHAPVEKTFRTWVKDLMPNRNPGRRPKDKPS